MLSMRSPVVLLESVERGAGCGGAPVGGSAQTREQRLFLVGGVLGRPLGEVAQRRVECRALLSRQLTAARLLGNHHQQLQKALDAPVAIAEDAEWVAEVRRQRCTDLNHR